MTSHSYCIRSRLMPQVCHSNRGSSLATDNTAIPKCSGIHPLSYVSTSSETCNHDQCSTPVTVYLTSTSCCVVRRASSTICKFSSLKWPKLDSLNLFGCCTGRVCLLGSGTSLGTGLKGMKGGALPGGFEMLFSTCSHQVTCSESHARLSE